jgi:hypothetical protein
MKDERTRRLRQAITELAPAALPDQRAQAGRTVLSFRSATHPERHTWIDTDLGGTLEIDLEDWTKDTTWDNSVAHLSAPDEKVPGIVQAWLSGATVGECIHLGGHPQFYNLQEAVTLVLDQLSSAGKEHLRGLNTEGEVLTEAIRVHHGLGRWIRNTCGLWSNKNLLRSIADSHMREIERRFAEAPTLGPEVKHRLEIELAYFQKCRRDDFFHPDDFSTIILRAVWRRLKATEAASQE